MTGPVISDTSSRSKRGQFPTEGVKLKQVTEKASGLGLAPMSEAGIEAVSDSKDSPAVVSSSITSPSYLTRRTVVSEPLRATSRSLKERLAGASGAGTIWLIVPLGTAWPSAGTEVNVVGTAA